MNAPGDMCVGKWGFSGRRGWLLGSILLLLTVSPMRGQSPYYYSINKGNITVAGGRIPGGAVVVPSMMDGLPITVIGSPLERTPVNPHRMTLVAPPFQPSAGRIQLGTPRTFQIFTGEGQEWFAPWTNRTDFNGGWTNQPVIIYRVPVP